MSAHEPAFPFNELNDDGTRFLSRAGLTKREYFAGLAMQGMCAGDYWGENVSRNPDVHRPVAELAVIMADALIAALKEQQP